MNIFKLGMTSLGRLLFLAGMLAAFLFGMAAVVYMSLSGEEVKVPELVGRDFVESEKELASLGLKIKKRADRPSTEKMNTVLEQLPRPGETVKTGQMILVVVSKAGLTQDERPESLKKDIEEDDTKKIEEMISDKPKRQRPNANSNANTNANTPRKVADTARDVGSNSSTSSNTAGGDGPARTDDAAERRETPPANTGERPNRNTTPGSTPRPQASPLGSRPSSGDTRPRTADRP